MFECGKDKSPGPNGFSLAVIQRNWEVVNGDLLKVLRESSQAELLTEPQMKLTYVLF